MKSTLIAILALAATGGAWAAESHDAHASHGSATAAAPAALSDGEVRRIDRDAGKLTIRHGPLANLDMPPMTMVFQVKDRAMLDAVKVGDKIRFNAAKEGGAYVVTHVEAAK